MLFFQLNCMSSSLSSMAIEQKGATHRVIKQPQTIKHITNIINNQTYHKQKPNLSYQPAIVNSDTIPANPKNNYLQSRHIVATLVVGRALGCPPLCCSHPIYTTEIKPRSRHISHDEQSDLSRSNPDSRN
jgi:hypothetical protein